MDALDLLEAQSYDDALFFPSHPLVVDNSMFAPIPRQLALYDDTFRWLLELCDQRQVRPSSLEPVQIEGPFASLYR